ncbi:MAG: cation transporter dimerization domain-containing protein, partial [Acidimicrobiia bacterium]
MDAVDPAIVEHIRNEASNAPGVHAVHETKVRWLGHRLVADLTIDVDGTATVRDGHTVATSARQRLLEQVAHVDDVHIHVHPTLDGEISRAVPSEAADPATPGQTGPRPR